MLCARRLGGNPDASLDIGCYAGFGIRLVRKFRDDVEIHLCGRGISKTEYGDSELGNITRIVNLAERLGAELETTRGELVNLKQQLTAAKEECGKPFPEEERLLELQKKKVQLDLALEFKEGGDVAEEGAESSGQENAPVQQPGKEWNDSSPDAGEEIGR